MFNLKIKAYNIDITTFRKDIKYEDNRKPIKIKYIDNFFIINIPFQNLWIAVS